MKPLGQFRPNFMWIILGKREPQICENVLDVTKMAAMPIYGKNLLHKPKPYDLEIWHAALDIQALQSLHK